MRLQSRLALLFGVVVTAAAALMGALSYAAMADRLEAQTDESLREYAAAFVAALDSGRVPQGMVPGREGPRGRHGQTWLVLPTQVVLPDGQVIAAQGSDVNLPTDRQDVAIARASAPIVRYRYVALDDGPFRMLTEGAGGSSGAVQVARDWSENAEVLRSLAVLLTIIGLLVACLAAGTGWLVARRSARRLVRLTETAERVTETGRLDAQVPQGGSDEIARLGGAFNAMLVRLAQAREDQQRLVQDAGHELRTPLTSLRTNISLLRRFDDMPPATRERVIADLSGETQELTTLVNEVVLLAAEPPADATPQPVALAPLAESVAARAFRRTGRRVDVRADGSVVLGQPTTLERAMWNLVENAAKFSPAGSPIELRISHGAVVVADRGPGIEQSDLPHVFDRFYRSTSARSQPGSGLGLAIVRDVAASHGGRVMVANRAGGGAELGFWIPPQPPVTASQRQGAQ